MRTNPSVTFFIFLITSLTASYTVAGTVKEYLSTGDTYFSHFDNRNALNYYEKAYEAEPGNYECILKLTRSYNDLGEELFINHDRASAEPYINKAVQMSDTLLKKFPDSAEAYSFSAMCLGNYALFKGGKEKVKLAIQIEKAAKTALKMNPKKVLPYIILGMYYQNVANLSWLEKFFANTFFGKLPDGSFEDSIRMLDKANAIDPNVIITQYQLAKTYRLMGNDKKELDCLRRVLILPQGNFRDKYLIAKAKKRLQILTAQNID